MLPKGMALMNISLEKATDVDAPKNEIQVQAFDFL